MQGKAEGELRGTVNMLRGLKHPKRHVEGSGAALTLTQEGRCGKNQMPLSTTPERAPGGLCWQDLGLRDAAQGRQGLLGHSHSLLHAQGIPGNSRSEAVATELWLSQAEKLGCVPGDKQQPLSHSAGHPTLWKHFPWCQHSCRAQLGKPQQLLPSKGCFPALLVAVLPRCWSVWFLQSAPAKAVCALCQLPSCAATGSI